MSELTNSLGVPNPTPFPSTLSSIYQNPYWMLNRTAINETRDRIVGFLTAKFRITDWPELRWQGQPGQTLRSGEEKVFKWNNTLWPTLFGDYIKKNITVTDKWFDAILEGNNTLTSDLKINHHVGAIFHDSKYDAT